MAAPDSTSFLLLDGHGLLVIDVATATFTRRTSFVGFDGFTLAAAPDNRSLWLLDLEGTGVLRLDLPGLAAAERIEVAGATADELAISADSRTVYLSGYETTVVHSIDAPTMRVSAPIELPGPARTVTTSGDTTIIGAGTSLLALSAGYPMATCDLGFTLNSGATADGQLVVAGWEANPELTSWVPATELVWLDPATLAEQQRRPAPTQPIGMAISDGRLLIADAKTATVLIHDAETGQLLATVPVGQEPASIAALPDGDALVISRDGIRRIDPTRATATTFHPLTKCNGICVTTNGHHALAWTLRGAHLLDLRTNTITKVTGRPATTRITTQRKSPS